MLRSGSSGWMTVRTTVVRRFCPNSGSCTRTVSPTATGSSTPVSLRPEVEHLELVGDDGLGLLVELDGGGGEEVIFVDD